MVRTGRYFLTVSALIISGLLTMTILSGSAAQATQNEQGAHHFSFTSIEGNPMPFSQYKGRVLVVVNTASRCGFTPQYDGLQALYDSFRDDGLVVIGVPSGDFGSQELAEEGDIKEFCEVNFNITFPMTEKTTVKGPQAHPFYQWAAEQGGRLSRPRWNFHKYLIGRDGRLLDWFAPTTSPDSEKMRDAVRVALSQS